MPVPATEAKKGQVLKIDSKYFLIVDYHLMTPGNKRGFIQFKLKDIAAGSTAVKKIYSDDMVEVANLDRQSCEYLYKDGNNLVFMNQDSYEQIEIPAENLEDVTPYLLNNQEVTVTFLDGNPVAVDLPASVALEVVEAEPSTRGNTATNVTKLCKLETGLELKVPPFINAGEKVKVDTRTGEFISRA